MPDENAPVQPAQATRAGSVPAPAEVSIPTPPPGVPPAQMQNIAQPGSDPAVATAAQRAPVNAASISTSPNPKQPGDTPSQPLPDRDDSGKEAAPVLGTPPPAAPAPAPVPTPVAPVATPVPAVAPAPATTLPPKPDNKPAEPPTPEKAPVASGATVEAPGAAPAAVTAPADKRDPQASKDTRTSFAPTSPLPQVEILFIDGVYVAVRTPGEGGIHQSRTPLEADDVDAAELEVRQLLSLDDDDKDKGGQQWKVILG
jgi:hypothetical protein